MQIFNLFTYMYAGRLLVILLFYTLFFSNVGEFNLNSSLQLLVVLWFGLPRISSQLLLKRRIYGAILLWEELNLGLLCENNHTSGSLFV